MKTTHVFSNPVDALHNRPHRLLYGGISIGLLSFFFFSPLCRAQQVPLGPLSEPSTSGSLLTSTVTPGTVFLFDLERKFAAAVAAGGGPAFASFFDPEGMTLANRQPPLIGQQAIAAHSTWSPNDYQLTWKPDGGALSPAGDMGYTWGHYEGRSTKAGIPVERGRYLTVWKKEPDGVWKILMDSSNEDPPTPECKCSIDSKP